MLDLLLATSHQHKEREMRKQAAIAAYATLPKPVLEKLAYCSEDEEWLKKFQGTALIDQALALEEQMLTLKQQQQQEQRLRRQQWSMGDQLSDQLSDLRLQREMLELQLYKLQAGQAPSAEAAPVAPAAPATEQPAMPPGMTTEKMASALGRLRALAEVQQAKQASALGAMGSMAGAGLGALHSPQAAMLGVPLGGLAGVLGDAYLSHAADKHRAEQQAKVDLANAVHLAKLQDIAAHPHEYAVKSAAAASMLRGALGAAKSFANKNPDILGQAAVGAIGGGISTAMSGGSMSDIAKNTAMGAAGGALTGGITSYGGKVVNAYKAQPNGGSSVMDAAKQVFDKEKAHYGKVYDRMSRNGDMMANRAKNQPGSFAAPPKPAVPANGAPPKPATAAPTNGAPKPGQQLSLDFSGGASPAGVVAPPNPGAYQQLPGLGNGFAGGPANNNGAPVQARLPGM